MSCTIRNMGAVLASPKTATKPARVAEPAATQTLGTGLDRITASYFLEGMNHRLRMEFISADWCTIGDSSTAHRAHLEQHDNGMLTVEPSCGIGYWGSGADRIRPKERPNRFCQRPGCVYDIPARRAPSITVIRPTQMELDLTS